MPLQSFHPLCRAWFERELGAPTPAQAEAWPAIQAGEHCLIAAPTGSGKTLAAFYAMIDELIQEGLQPGGLAPGIHAIYISPLKALSNDIHRNLQVPLAGLQEELDANDLPRIDISVAVRTGDTTQSERQKMLRKPPHILVTTPESLYLLLTSARGRDMLRSCRRIIIDEIHAMLGDKRGTHLSLSLQRLEGLVDGPLQRIGLSATQKPIDLVASFLVGNHNKVNGVANCKIIDTGHKRPLELSLEVPKSPLSAVMSNEIWVELYERLVELIQQHDTTLIFVNTRRLTERLALALAERIGEEHVTSHHGSMSKEHRHAAEQNLKQGKLKVLVATASMELGIDIGSVNLVVQFSSPKSIAALLQRVGRSGHFVGGIPKGVIFPLSRDDLVECTALLDSVHRGELDRIVMPENCLDILAQQIVAEAASEEEWEIEELYELFHRAYPYRNLSKEEFIRIIRMLADGFSTRRGRRGSHLHYDAINHRIRARKGARLTAIMNGGSIPDMFDYEVVLQPEGITVGSLNEDYALETLPGDIFTLGTHAWQMQGVEGLKVLVTDANGQQPTIPFWFGEGPGRTRELSESISRLKQKISEILDEDPLPAFIADNFMDFKDNLAVNYLRREIGLSASAAEQMVLYLSMGKTGLGLIPGRKKLAMERFFDEAGDMHLVIHSPYGSRVNRAWGLALRKKFCVNFNFELQAAANEDSIVISLSSTHSFPLEEVFDYLNAKIVRETLIQAMLDAPMFEVRWRWNATRALAIQRQRSGGRVPPQLQRMQAEDLIAQVFPDQIACAENISGKREIPDHPLVNQVIEDCLHEAMDIDELEELLSHISARDFELTAKDLREPSIFAQEIINARPYAFLDDTEFAERRVNAIRNRSWLDPGEASDLSKLDPAAISRVMEEAWPLVRSADELHDALSVHGFFTASEGKTNAWQNYFKTLCEHQRACKLEISKDCVLWIASERIPIFREIFPQAHLQIKIDLPAWIEEEQWSPEEARREIVRGRLEALGPVTQSRLAEDMAADESDIQLALLALEAEGFAFRGKITGDQLEWCERRLLQRIHKYTIESLRQSIKPVAVQDFMLFLLDRHGLSAEEKPSGPGSLEKVLEQLEGCEAPAAAWEADLLPARIGDYDPAWLDGLCLSGRLVWGRLNPPRPGKEKTRGSGPVKSTPICLVPRGTRSFWQQLARSEIQEKEFNSKTQAILDCLDKSGACFFDDIVNQTPLLRSQVEECLAELVASGQITSDSYAGLRALLTPSYNKGSARSRSSRRTQFGIESAGRWSRTPYLSVDEKEKYSLEVLEELVEVYLSRWGVIFRSLLEKEAFAPPWRLLVRVLRRLELKGELRGGRFVSGVSGEQFAHPDTVKRLRRFAKDDYKSGKLVTISAADPLNLLGTILPGRKIARRASNRLLLRDGKVIAVFEGKEVKFLEAVPEEEIWELQKKLITRDFPPRLRAYLGRSYQ